VGDPEVAIDGEGGAVRTALFEGPGLWLLSVVRAPGATAFPAVRVSVDGGPPVIVTLPLPDRGRFLVRTRARRVAFAFHAGDVASVTVERVGLRNLAGLARWRRKDFRLRGEIAAGVTVMPLFWAAGGESRGLAAGLRLLDRWGFGLGTRSFQETAALFDPSPEVRPAGVAGAPRFGIVLHLYYADLWPELRAWLAALRPPFDLVVTTPPENAALGARVAADFPGAEIRIMENRGRDVGPFVELLGEGRFDSWPLLLKIHGKRSGNAGPRALLGDAWRKASFDDLLGGDARVEEILRRFAAHPHLGMAGPARFRIPGGPVTMRRPFGLNQATTLALAARMGIPPATFRLDFFAGTMFWARPQALAPLKELGLRLADFPAAAGPEDGALQHAVERVFAASVVKAGMQVEDVPPRYAQRAWGGR
jgi:hypothetical protein